MSGFHALNSLHSCMHLACEILVCEFIMLPIHRRLLSNSHESITHLVIESPSNPSNHKTGFASILVTESPSNPCHHDTVVLLSLSDHRPPPSLVSTIPSYLNPGYRQAFRHTPRKTLSFPPISLLSVSFSLSLSLSHSLSLLRARALGG